MEKIIYIAVNGIGLGHAGRSVEIANTLEIKGISVAFSSYGEAVRYISERGYLCHEVPTFHLFWRSTGEMDLRASLRYLLSSSHLAVMNQIREEVRLMRRHRPALVLSDARGSAIIAARLLDLPVFTLTNQLVTYSPVNDNRLSKMVNFLSPLFFPKLWGLSTHVFIPDFQPPHTVSQRNIEPGLRYLDSYSFVGPLLRQSQGDAFGKQLIEILGDESKPLIYASASGPAPDRKFFTNLLKGVLPHLTDDFNVVFSLGELGGATKPSWTNGVLMFDWLPQRLEMMRLADVIISRAGRTTINQAITYQTPLLLIPAAKQTEQEENAKRISELGIGLSLDQEQLSGETLIIALREIMNNHNLYLNNLNFLSEKARELGGVEGVVDLLLQWL